MAKHDWPTIRKDYVEGIEEGGKIVWPTLEAVQEKHGVTAGRLFRERAASEQWVELRDKFRLKQEQARQTSRVKAMGNGAAKFDAKILQAANGLADLLVKGIALLQPEQTGELRSTSASLVNVQRAGRIALGEPADGPMGHGGQLLGTVLIRVSRDGAYGQVALEGPPEQPLLEGPQE